jgi:protein involved in polysaccharide export with SLBB domain
LRRFQAILSALLISFVTACGGGQAGQEVQRVRFPEIKPPPPGAVETEPQRIRSGDVVSMKFLNNPELNENVQVRSDGKISLALVGEMTVAGLTLAELRTRISERFKSFVVRTGYGELLKEGDDLEIRFLYNPELNQTLRIRSDGKISLPLIGELEAAGVRPAQLRKRLIEKYAKDIKNPDVAVLTGPNTAKKIFSDEAFISVTLSKPADLEVFVGGEVQTAKAVKFEGPLTTLQAIMQAGGVKETGDLSRVVVLRRGQFEQAEWILTNLSEPVSGKSLRNDIVLSGGDVVIVPRSGIAEWNLWVKQYIKDMLPIQPFASLGGM